MNTKNGVPATTDTQQKLKKIAFVFPIRQCYAQSAQGSGALKVMQGQQGQQNQQSQTRTMVKGVAAQAGGVNVYADTRVDGRDRARLERLLRYMLRV